MNLILKGYTIVTSNSSLLILNFLVLQKIILLCECTMFTNTGQFTQHLP